jgi:hypothetical protein
MFPLKAGLCYAGNHPAPSLNRWGHPSLLRKDGKFNAGIAYDIAMLLFCTSILNSWHEKCIQVGGGHNMP